MQFASRLPSDEVDLSAAHKPALFLLLLFFKKQKIQNVLLGFLSDIFLMRKNDEI